MKKKILAVCLSLLMLVGMVTTLSSCSSDTSENAKKYGYDHKDAENMLTFISTCTESTCADITASATTLIESLGENFDTYSENKSSVTEYYKKSLAIADSFHTALKAVTVDYYKYLAKNQAADYELWNDSMDDVYDAWTDATDDFYDAWTDSFEDIYDTCDDLIKSGYDDLPYKEYADIWSDMYDEYSDSWSDMYDKHSDNWGELYDTHSDVWGAFYDGETDIESIVNPKLDEYANKDIVSTTEKAKDDAPAKPIQEDDTESTAPLETNSIEELETFIISDAEKMISSLTSEYETLSASITTYDEYVANIAKVEAYYEKVNNTSYQISVKMYEYSLSYAKMIINSDMSTDDMYDALDGIYDIVYEDVGDILYDGIYNGILDDIYDDFYDGIVSDGYEITSYENWSDARSNEYELWSNTRSDCYEHWSDVRSDVYEFWTDMRSELYSDDIERAQKVIDNFNEDIQKLSN